MKIFVKKLFSIIGKGSLRKLMLLFGAMILMAFLEVLGIASVFPFMTLVMQPEMVHQNTWLRWAYETFNFQSQDAFLLATGITVLIFFTGSNTFSIFMRWLQHRFTWSTAHMLSTRLLKTYMYSPYKFFLANNTSELNKQVLAEITLFVQNLLLPATEFCARLIASVFIFTLLVVVDPLLASIVLVLLGGAYLGIFFGIRTYLTKIGEHRRDALTASFKAANEALTGIKLIKIHNSEPYFLNRFVRASRVHSMARAKQMIIAQAPRYLVETFAFGGIIVVILHLIASGQGIEMMIPRLSLYAVAGYRLLPSLQRLYSAFTSVRYYYPMVDEIYRDLASPTHLAETPENDTPDDVVFQQDITLQGIIFQYPDTDEAVLRNINLHIAKGTKVALVGLTGSGKTTLVDLIMGLLHPQEGHVLVDGLPITPDRVKTWRNLVGYVPQDVFLMDDTIIRNIAFGVPDEAIDRSQVTRVARIANVHAFIEELPDGYNTVIGERGVRLSGGQRQRMGLARALYREPQVLVLDEATSALDGITEEAVFQAINDLPKDMTMIMIAHRLATVRACDHFYLLKNGHVVDEGTYQGLVETNATFRKMARLTT